MMSLFEVYYTHSKLQLMMPLYEGGDVYNLIDEKECIPEKDVCRLIWQVLRALNYLHLRSVTHRDLKPENLAFESRKKHSLKLIDFGFALDLSDPVLRKDESLIFMGTPYYMPPEVVNSEQLTILRMKI